MDKLRVTWALLALLGLAGCQTRHQDFGALPHPPQLASQKGGTIFTFVIHSDPRAPGYSSRSRRAPTCGSAQHR